MNVLDRATERRELLARGFGLLATCLTPPAWAQAAGGYAGDFWRRPRTIRLQHASGDKIEATYWSDGVMVVDEYMRLSWFMRDRVVGSGVYMSPVLLDIVYSVGGWLEYFGMRQPIVMQSGYRDARRNATIEGAARNSKHVSGEAIDIHIPGVSSTQVARFGLWLGGGGVGWYPSRGFTHLDRGRLRVWRG